MISGGLVEIGGLTPTFRLTGPLVDRPGYPPSSSESTMYGISGVLMTFVGSVSSIIRFPEFEILRFGGVLRFGFGRTEISSEVVGVGGEILQVSLCEDISGNRKELTINFLLRCKFLHKYSNYPDNDNLLYKLKNYKTVQAHR